MGSSPIVGTNFYLEKEMIYNVIIRRTNREVARIEAEGIFDVRENFSKIFPKEEFIILPMDYGKAIMLCEHGN